MSAFRLAFQALSPAGRRGRLNAFIFHRVHHEQDPLFPGEMHAERFREVLGWLRDWFQVLAIDEAIARMREGDLPARAAVITFDDGYADNHAVALPLLEQAGLSACFFIASGFLDGGRMWNDTLIEAIRLTRLETLDVRDLSASYADLQPMDLTSWPARRTALESLIARTKYLPMAERQNLVDALAQAARVELPRHLMMSSAELREMRRRGMVIGAHTVQHPILAKLDAPQAQTEIVEGRRALENILDQRIGLFAYPNGKPGADYLPAHVDIVRKAGFDAAMTTEPGAASMRTELFEIPRFTPWDSTPNRFGLRLVKNLL